MKRFIICMITAAAMLSGAAAYADEAASGTTTEAEVTATATPAATETATETPATAEPEETETATETPATATPAAAETVTETPATAAPTETATAAPEETAKPTAKPTLGGKDRDKTDHGIFGGGLLGGKENRENALNKFNDLKERIKDAKDETKEYIKEIRDIFGDVGKDARKEVLNELAALKQKENDTSIDTFVNGLHIDFSKYDNVLPVIENDHTLMPIRAIAEALGAEVEWDGDTGEITITKDDVVINLTVGSTTAYVNGEKEELDVAPEIRSERTIVPARFISEGFGLNVDWDEDSKTVIIDDETTDNTASDTTTDTTTDDTASDTTTDTTTTDDTTSDTTTDTTVE